MFVLLCPNVLVFLVRAGLLRDRVTLGSLSGMLIYITGYGRPPERQVGYGSLGWSCMDRITGLPWVQVEGQNGRGMMLGQSGIDSTTAGLWMVRELPSWRGY